MEMLNYAFEMTIHYMAFFMKNSLTPKNSSKRVAKSFLDLINSLISEKKNVAVLGTIPRTTEWSNKTEDVNHYLTDM